MEYDFSFYAGIFEPTNSFEPVFQPSTFVDRYGTEETPLFDLKMINE
jgi:hypothetical protein